MSNQPLTSWSIKLNAFSNILSLLRSLWATCFTSYNKEGRYIYTHVKHNPENRTKLEEYSRYTLNQYIANSEKLNACKAIGTGEERKEVYTSHLKESYTTASIKLVTKYTPNSTYRTKNRQYHRDSLKQTK